MKLIETIWNPTVLIYSLKLHFWDGSQKYQHDRREVYLEMIKDNLDQNDTHSKIFEPSVIYSVLSICLRTSYALLLALNESKNKVDSK